MTVRQESGMQTTLRELRHSRIALSQTEAFRLSTSLRTLSSMASGLFLPLSLRGQLLTWLVAGVFPVFSRHRREPLFQLESADAMLRTCREVLASNAPTLSLGEITPTLRRELRRGVRLEIRRFRLASSWERRNSTTIPARSSCPHRVSMGMQAEIS